MGILQMGPALCTSQDRSTSGLALPEHSIQFRLRNVNRGLLCAEPMLRAEDTGDRDTTALTKSLVWGRTDNKYTVTETHGDTDERPKHSERGWAQITYCRIPFIRNSRQSKPLVTEKQISGWEWEGTVAKGQGGNFGGNGSVLNYVVVVVT